MPQIFDHQDYRRYLQEYLRALPKRGHGFRLQMARAMGCEPGYVSRVLSEKAHLSLEQAEALSALLGHTRDERSFFYLMLQADRSGTPSLREFFLGQMKEISGRRLVGRNRVPERLPLTLEQQARYFSHWHYAAVHTLVSIPLLQDREPLQRRLGIPPRRLQQILEFLVEANLIRVEADRYRVGETRIQLPGSSPLISKHHINWRVRAIQALDDDPELGLHYSAVMSMSQEAAIRIRELYLRAIEEMNRLVKDAPDQVCNAFTIDFFEL